MRRVFHRIEVIEISEELVESMHRGQELIEVAKVILTELASCVPLGFERGGNGAGLCWVSCLLRQS
jgi:hypothetical protein